MATLARVVTSIIDSRAENVRELKALVLDKTSTDEALVDAYLALCERCSGLYSLPHGWHMNIAKWIRVDLRESFSEAEREIWKRTNSEISWAAREHWKSVPRTTAGLRQVVAELDDIARNHADLLSYLPAADAVEVLWQRMEQLRRLQPSPRPTLPDRPHVTSYRPDTQKAEAAIVDAVEATHQFLRQLDEPSPKITLLAAALFLYPEDECGARTLANTWSSGGTSKSTKKGLVTYGKKGKADLYDAKELFDRLVAKGDTFRDDEWPAFLEHAKSTTS